MLILSIPESELFDPSTEEFIKKSEKDRLQFEHCLLAVFKWESKYNKSFFLKDKKTDLEMLDYMCYMCLNYKLKPEDLDLETQSILSDYINKTHTASSVSSPGGGSNQILTSELIYAYMAIGNIPFTCERWNLERLLILLAMVANLNNPDKKKMPINEIIAQNRSLNAQRKKELNTKG